MEPSASTPASEQDQAFAALVESIERLDELGLRDELGRVVVEPASVFHWS